LLLLDREGRPVCSSLTGGETCLLLLDGRGDLFASP